jgi:hypothetical protein
VYPRNSAIWLPVSLAVIFLYGLLLPYVISLGWMAYQVILAPAERRGEALESDPRLGSGHALRWNTTWENGGDPPLRPVHKTWRTRKGHRRARPNGQADSAAR